MIDISKLIGSGQRVMPPKLLVYGDSGVGKTTLFAGDPKLGEAGAPKPLFLMGEDRQGLLSLSRYPMDRPLDSWSEFMDALEWVAAGKHDYETLVVDGFEQLEAKMHSWLCEVHGEDNIDSSRKGSKFSFQKGFKQYAVPEIREMCRALDHIRSKRNMVVALVCHETVQKYKHPDYEAYDIFAPSINQFAAKELEGWADGILHCKFKLHVVSTDEGFGKERAHAKGIGERVMRTEHRPSHWGKNTWSLPYELPLSWTAFDNAVAASAAATNTPKQEQDK